MTAPEVGRARFVDGMRVTREHLDHLQDVLHAAALQARGTAGLGRVSFGLRVEATAPPTVTVAPGLAIDRDGRPLELAEPRGVAIDPGEATTFLCLLHTLRSEGLVDGVPTLLFDDVAVEARVSAPPYQDAAVVVARIDSGADGMRIAQLPDWFLTRQAHEHSGTFVLEEGRWRYDGLPVGFQGPLFDSGFVSVDPGDQVTLVHGLRSTDLLVQLQARAEDGVVTTEGIGSRFWYELASDQEVRLVHGNGRRTSPLELRATIWPLVPAAAGPTIPIADAGPDAEVDPGVSFTLDGSRSRAFGGRSITKYVWTKTT